MRTARYHFDMRTTVSLPDPLLEHAKEYAEARGMTLSAVLEDALRCFLAGKPAPFGKSFSLPAVGGKLVNAGLDLAQTSALVTMDDEAASWLRRGQAEAHPTPPKMTS